MPNEGWLKLMAKADTAFAKGSKQAVVRILEEIVRAGAGITVNHDIPAVREAHLALGKALLAAKEGDLERAKDLYRQNITSITRD